MDIALVFIDEIRFSLVGTFLHNSTASSTPVFLFIPPIPVEIVNGLPCVRWNSSVSLFYWSLDPKGKDRISEDNWESYGVPKLLVKTWIGSSWGTFAYRSVRAYFQLKNYNLNGEQYARDRGYLPVSRWDPHESDTDDWETSDELDGHHQLTSSSTYSLVEALEAESSSEVSITARASEGVGAAKVVRWIKGLGETDTLQGKNADSDTWSVIDRES
ncbi:hypothetical protein V5O48_007835 [Marasmius crinis-equi]|uniref:Uncharacterized protein n=1 Tax=Marasmius crinis-equi TaxID=585013 RepID=A0ABR3FBM7_9AGAR